MNPSSLFLRWGTLLSAPAWLRATLALLLIMLLALATGWAGGQ